VTSSLLTCLDRCVLVSLLPLPNSPPRIKKFMLEPLPFASMAASLPPSGWIEQVLNAANLPLLIPMGNTWAESVGCRSCDVNKDFAVELIEHLSLRSVPARRLLGIILQAVEEGTLSAVDAIDPCQEAMEEAQDADATEEGEQDALPIPSPPSASAEPAGSPQQFCVTHEKMRDATKMRRNARGEMVCMQQFKCLYGPTPRRAARSRSPRTDGRRRRPRGRWDSGDISAHIAGLGRYPQRSPDLHREQDGSFSLDAVMDYWATDAGLTLESIQKALQAHLFKNIGRAHAILRFQITQGPDAHDPVMIMIPHAAGA
jgi:hypothetical protein